MMIEIIFKGSKQLKNQIHTFGLPIGKNTGMSLEEHGDKEEMNMDSSTSSCAAKLHHFRVATATLPCTNRHPYTDSAHSANASRNV